MKILVFLFWVSWLLCAVLDVTIAQDAPVSSASADTLEHALAHADWDPSRRGVLLAVNPQGTRSLPQASLSDPSVGADASTLRLLAPRFARQLFPVRSVTALAPTTMTVLNTHPSKADPFANLTRVQKMTLLMGTLTPAQWQRLGSEEGLGGGNLTEKQQPMFASLLPTPFTMQRIRMQQGAAVPEGGQQITLTAEQRGGVRLRLNRSAQIYLPHDATHFVHDSGLALFPLAEGTQRYRLSFRAPGLNGNAYGVALRHEVFNRLKPGSVAFEAAEWDARVPLPGVRTVGDLVARLAQQTRRELYADGRVAVLPIWIRGTNARAGDLMQALCLCVTGTFRKVGPALLLTDDLEGIGTRRAQLTEWAQDAQAQQQAATTAAARAARVLRPLQYIPFSPDDPFALTEADLQKLTASRMERGQSNEYHVPLSALPLGQQDILKAFLARDPNPPSHEDVKVYLSTVISYVVPGAGHVSEATDVWANADVPQPALPAPPLPDIPTALPTSASVRALLVALPSTLNRAAMQEQAGRLAAAARRHGLNQLWIESDGSRNEGDLLADFAAAGKHNGLAVVAVVRLMRGSGRTSVPADTAGVELRDVNLRGETASAYAARTLASEAARSDGNVRQRFVLRDDLTIPGDWLCPDAPATRAYLEARLRVLAAVLGLAGIAFKDVAAPGYEDAGGQADPFGVFRTNDFGYTPAMRLAFLRQKSYDPLDLAVRGNMYLAADVDVPFFPDNNAPFHLDGQTLEMQPQKDKTISQEWNAFRFHAQCDLLMILHAFLQTNYPRLLLWMRYAPNSDGWWGRWDKPAPLLSIPADQAFGTAAQAARLTGRPVVLHLPYWGSLTPEAEPTSAPHFAAWVKQRLEARKSGWEGITLDLSALPWSQALSVLDGLEVAKKP